MLQEEMPSMDTCCKVAFGIGLVVLVLIILNDFIRSKATVSNTNTGSSSCFRTNIKNVTDQFVTSAKKAFSNGRSEQRDDSVRSPPPSVQDYLARDELWPYSDVPETRGSQNTDLLNKSFKWDVPNGADNEVHEKFDQVAIDKEQVKRKASIRPVGPHTATEHPKHTRNTGMVNPVLELHRRGCGKEKPPVFNQQQVPSFNQSEAHYQASISVSK